jgi:hypothetical protein
MTPTVETVGLSTGRPPRCDQAVPENGARQVMNTGIDCQPRTVDVGAIATLS